MFDMLSNLLTQETAPRVLVVLLDSGVKGLALLALAAGATLALRRASAASRHLVWTLAMAGLLLLPALSVVVPKWQLPLLPPGWGMRPTPSPLRTTTVTPWTENRVPVPSSTASAISPPRSPQARPEAASRMFPLDAETASASAPPSAPLASPAPPRRPVAFWALTVWLGVAGVILLPLLAGLAAVARLIRAAYPFADAEWYDRLRGLSAALGVDRPVHLLCAGPGAMPMAVGLLRPTILLPQEADTWPEEKRRAVLLHELAHVARRDCLTHALARVALALHWFNPLAWVALRQMRVERERACDDRVLTTGERASAYADHLLDIARTMHAGTLASVAAITMAKQSQLEGRLLAVLDPKRNRYALTRWTVIAAIAGVTALLLPLAATKVTAPPPVADTPAAIWDQAKPVRKTTLEAKGIYWRPKRVWRKLPFNLDPSDPAESCAAIAQRVNTQQTTGGNRFENDVTRQELEDILRQRPDYFYAEYLLGTWHRLKGNQTIADDWYRRSFRHAPAIFVQPYTQTDGTPVESGQIVRTFILACYHQKGGVQLPQELWYPLVETDERGAIYLPAYPTVVMTNTLRSGIRSLSSLPDPTIYRPAYKGAMNNLVRYFVDFPGRDYFESEGRIGLLPAAVVQKIGSGSYDSSGKRNPTFSEISTISPGDSASLPEEVLPPQLRMISTWTSAKQTPDSLVAWKPDGRPVDNPDEQQALANYPSSTDSAEPTTQPVVLGLWFHHPLFDHQSEIWLVFYDSAHKKVDSRGGGSNNDPETHKRFPGWRCMKNVFESTQLPDRGQVELRYSLGPWTYFPTTILPNQTGKIPNEPLIIHSINSTGPNATEVSFTVLIPNAENARQCEMVALTDRDSTATVELETRQSGFQLLPDNTGGRYSFHFEVPLEKIKGFRIRHRPVQRYLYDNVVFRRTAETPPPVTAKPQDGIQIRFVESESNVSPDSGTTETVYTWRIDTTETLQVLYRPIQQRADGSFEGAFLNETTRVNGSECPIDLTVRWRVEAGKLLVWTEYTERGGGGGGRTTPDSIPIESGTTLQFQNRRKPFILDNRHYVSLWECQFVRDGKTLQTIAFIAAAAPKTDTEFKSALDLYSNGNSKNLPVIRLPEETEQPVPPKTNASPSSSSASTSTSSFGPVREAVVRQGGANSLLNLDTGAGFAPPTDLKSQEESLRWLVRNGIDLSGGNPTFVRELTGVDLVVETRPNDAWDQATAQDLRKSDALAVAPPSQPVRLSVDPNQPVTCAFKTREGGLGLLQVVGFEESPSGSVPNPPQPGIRIRYKLALPTGTSSPSTSPSPASPTGAAPALSQDTPTSPALEAALEGIQARMRLIRSKKMRFEYTRTTKKNERMPSDYTEKCVLFTHDGNYLEEAQLENGEKKYRYYFGVPDPNDSLYPNKLHQHEGARFDLEGPESRRVFSSHFNSAEMNGIDCTLVPQWAAPSMGYWPWSRKAGSTHNDPEHPGATFFEVEASSNGADRYSSQLGWARVGDKWPQCSEFTQIEGIYWPRRIVWGDETLLISKIETDFALDPTHLESPHLEAGWTVKISYPLWKANPGGSIRDAQETFEGKEILWGKPLSPQEIRILTVAQSRWPGAGAYEYNRGRYPLPYYDKERDVIVWAKYDTNLKQHLKVFEGDQLPESYGPLPWENIAKIVQGWIEETAR